MATMKMRNLLARPAAADFAVDAQWTLGKLNASEQIVPAVAGDGGFVIEETAKAGQPVTIALEGTTKVKVGAAVAPMQFLTSNAAGLAVPATVGQRLCGQAIGAGSAAGALVEMLIVHGTAP
jgi:hypothetical protein